MIRFNTVFVLLATVVSSLFAPPIVHAVNLPGEIEAARITSGLWKDGFKLNSVDTDRQVARFYLMEAVEDQPRAKNSKSWPTENRHHEWLTIDAAKKKATFEETKSLLKQAEILRVDASLRLSSAIVASLPAPK